MQLPPNLPKSLQFLDTFYEPASSAYQKACWLLSDFHALKWSYTFEFTQPMEIDWDVELEDGKSLTHESHSELWASFKYFLVASTHSHLGIDTEANANVTQYRRFCAATKVIDYLLINSSSLELAKYGLGVLTSSDLKSMLNNIASNSDTAESIYSWSDTLSHFCDQLIKSTPDEDLARTLEKIPELTNTDSEYLDGYNLELPPESLAAARAALYINNFYVRNAKWGFSPNSLKLSEILYRNTISGRHTSKPSIPVFTYRPDKVAFVREMPGARVTTIKHKKMMSSKVKELQSVIYNLGVLHELGLPAPAHSDLSKFLSSEIDLSEEGRFRTLPADIVFEAFANAIEYHIEHGEKIADAFCTVVEYCTENDLALTAISDSTLMTLVGKDMTDFGIKKLGLSSRSKSGLTYPATRDVKLDIREHFKLLRANTGLLEALTIYIGSVQLVVGALMARRQGELIDLHTSDCLDHTQRWLLFYNRKSSRSLFGLRQREARPIEPIAVQMINTLIKMQQRLLKAGYIDNMMGLFAVPALAGYGKMLPSTNNLFNRNLDLVCDYFQTSCNSQGERYYIRQHQLRRFFAMLFFHSCSFGGIDTLRWMLGHTDIMHIYRYITETVDGAVLRGAKAQHIAEQIHHDGIGAFEDLGALLKAKYGTQDFILSDAEELEEEIAALMKSGEVTVEPEFFTDQDGQHMKMLVKVTAKCT